MTQIMKINLYYANVPNFGDKLNQVIIKEVFGYDTRRRLFLTANMSAIGSGLGRFSLSNNPFIACAQLICGLLFPNVIIWGTGFISYSHQNSFFYRRKMQFYALRGVLSKRKVEEILCRTIHVSLGDPGILSSFLISNVKKKYNVGIIAHYKEQDDPIFVELLKFYKNAVFIDVKQDPINVITQISECNCILSSSLHGLIVADSFNIPNLHIVVTNKLLGDGFKFDDYYSAYGLVHKKIDIYNEKFPTEEEIKNQYSVSAKMVQKMKQDLIDSFPYHSTNRKLLAVSSFGGHWVQLLRIGRSMDKKYEVVYCSTYEECEGIVEGCSYYKMTDFNRRNAWKMILAVMDSVWIIRKVRPSAVISTGAAPGLMMLLVAKIFRIKTIWVDSMANVEHPSACGRIASRFVTRCYVQWPHLGGGRFHYSGNILGESL